MGKRASGEGSIRQRKDGRWEGRCSCGYAPKTGKPIRRSVYGLTQKEVREKLTSIAKSIDDNTYIAPKTITVGDWLELWLKEYVQVSVKPLTFKSYEVVVRVHIKPAIGSIKLQALKAPQIQAFYNSLITDKSPKTIKNIHGVLHKALDKAIKIGYITTNPASVCDIPRIEKKEIKPLNADNISRFIKRLDTEEYKNLYITTLFTGMREGEVLGLTWDCVDFERGTITVNKQLQKEKIKGGKYYLAETKTSKVRVLTPAQYVMSILKEEQIRQKENRLKLGHMWDNPLNLVFTNTTGRYLAIVTVYKRFKKIVSEIGIPQARFHDLRHTYATLALQEGDDIKTVQTALGHSTVSTTLDIYSHTTETMRKESSKRMDNFINKVI